ncbi:MAG: glycosyltransferase [Methanobacterium sp.]|nr:glycosyltransferase [Methanobacterium sp.]
MNCKISIIVPVYNIENYLGQCLESLVSQTLKEIEIICVNDGSTDGSTEILEVFASKDDRIKIINKENAGLGAARNTGMLEVKGEYIGFVDSDDYVDTTMYEKLYNNAKNYDSDMVMCTIGIIDENNGEAEADHYYDLKCLDERFNEGTFNYKDTKDCILLLAVNAYNKIYKSEFIDRIEAKFPEGLIFEDNPFFYHTYLNADKVSLVMEPLYIHRINREGSITSGADKRFFDIVKIQNLNMECFKSLPNYEDYKAEVIDKKISAVIHRYFQVDEVHRQEFFELIKQDFKAMNLTDEELNELKHNKRNYLNILRSDTRKEFELFKDNVNKKFKIRDLENLNRKIKKNNRSIHSDNERLRSELTKLRSENQELKRLKTKLNRETKQFKEYLTFRGYVKYKTHNIFDRIKSRK